MSAHRTAHHAQDLERDRVADTAGRAASGAVAAANLGAAISALTPAGFAASVALDPARAGLRGAMP